MCGRYWNSWSVSSARPSRIRISPSRSARTGSCQNRTHHDTGAGSVAGEDFAIAFGHVVFVEVGIHLRFRRTGLGLEPLVGILAGDVPRLAVGAEGPELAGRHR